MEQGQNKDNNAAMLRQDDGRQPGVSSPETLKPSSRQSETSPLGFGVPSSVGPSLQDLSIHCFLEPLAACHMGGNLPSVGATEYFQPTSCC